MSQISDTAVKDQKVEDGLDEVIVSYSASVVEKEYFEFDPVESKDEILDQLDVLGIQITPPSSLEVQEWKESDILPANIHFDPEKIERIVIAQIDEGLFSLRIFTNEGYLEEQQFGQGRVLDLKRFHDLLIVNE